VDLLLSQDDPAGQLAASLQPISDPEPRRWNRKLPRRRSSPESWTGNWKASEFRYQELAAG